MFPNILFVLSVGSVVLPTAAKSADGGGAKTAFRNGDIVESILFLAEFRRTHPQEKAFLLLPKITKPQEPILPAVAYTLNAQIWIHSYRTGDQAVTVSRPLDGPEARLGLHSAFVRAWRGRLTAAVPGEKLSLFTDEQRVRAALAIPSPREDDERQVQRAFVQLKGAGIRVAIRQRNGSSYLVIEFEGLQYYWSPTLFSGYNGLAEAPALPSLISAVLFATDYHRRYPHEQVALFLRAQGPSAQGRSIGASTLFTKTGVVFVRDPRAGDLLTALKPADLKRRKEALTAADAVTQEAANERRKARQVAPSFAAIGSNPDTSVKAVFGLLQRSGIEVRTLGQSLIFRWAAKWYSYDGSVCRAVEVASKPTTQTALAP